MITAYFDCSVDYAQRRTTRHPDRRKVTRLCLTGVGWDAADVNFRAPGMHICGVHDPANFPVETVRHRGEEFEMLPGDTNRERFTVAVVDGDVEMYVDGWVMDYVNVSNSDGGLFCALRFRPPAFATNNHFLNAVPTEYVGSKRYVSPDDLPDRYLAPSGKVIADHHDWTIVGHRPMPFTSGVDVRDR